MRFVCTSVHSMLTISKPAIVEGPPPPDLLGLPHGYSLRTRPVPAPRPSPRNSAPVLPVDVPRRDEDGDWLVYLWEDYTPAAVENARYALERGHPWRLTYDPPGDRRLQSTGVYQSQKELFHLTTEELSGGPGIGQLDRDEYPPAIAREGGRGAVVTYIESNDNRSAGSQMGRQFAKLQDHSAAGPTSAARAR